MLKRFTVILPSYLLIVAGISLHLAIDFPHTCFQLDLKSPFSKSVFQNLDFCRRPAKRGENVSFNFNNSRNLKVATTISEPSFETTS